MNINERIRKVRYAFDLSQAKFAERISISSSYISDLEKGSREVNERIIYLVIAKFNVNEQWLRSGKGSMLNENESVVISEAMGIMKSLNLNVQKSALKILNVLAEMDLTTKTLFEH